MHRPRRLVSAAIVAVTMLAAACGGGDKSTGPTTLEGTYTLKTVNGSAPPVIIAQLGADKVEVLGGSLLMNANNTFSGSTTVRFTESGVVSTETADCDGSFTRSGNAVTFSEDDDVSGDCGGTYSGTFSNGNTLTVNFAPGIQAVFKK